MLDFNDAMRGTVEDRKARILAHAAFDPLWQQLGVFRSRDAAYEWLGEALQLPPDRCHMKQFDADLCRRVIALCLEKKYV